MARETISIGKLVFRTKKSAEDFVRNQIKAFNGKDPFWFDLIARHPEHKEKAGCGIDHFVLRENELNRSTVGVWIVRKDGSIIDFSWRTCVDGKAKTSRANLIAAMRNAIWEQAAEFKKSAQKMCTICETTEGEFHADHAIPFKTICDEFLKDREDKIPLLFDDEELANVAKFRVCDWSFELDWQRFHAEKVKWQMLCQKCNLSKGDR